MQRGLRISNFVDAGGVVVEIIAVRYSATMPNLDSLLERLKGRQRDLIMEAALSDSLPADSTLRRDLGT
ncbi:hypothetical protein [Methylobacterium sp. Leaf399]|uniref:hypothetical protein n=1 Tax=Methylobacterium sp. Leaf399 TaxID=1736364 RepID=UPI000ADECBFD|nr:hypothetical protein [Methylobacterium sp. Leaf399]